MIDTLQVITNSLTNVKNVDGIYDEIFMIFIDYAYKIAMVVIANF